MPRPPRGRLRPRARGGALAGACAVAAGLVVLAACVDLDSLGPGERPASDAADADAPPTVPLEAGRARFCADAEASLFCDDFDDDDAAPGARWVGIPGTAPGILLTGASELTLSGPFPPASAPSSLELSVDRNPGDVRPLAILASGVAATQRGVELVAEVRLVELTDKGDGGLAPDGGPPEPLTFSLMGIGTLSASTVGASVRLGKGELILVAGVQTSTASSTVSSSVPFNYDSVMQSTWVRVHLALGERDAISARLSAATGAGPSVCPASKAVAAAWASAPVDSAMCITLVDSLVPLRDQIVAAVLGTALEVPMKARVQFDNVVVDGIP